jgi:FkbM family methyltransferase
VGGRSFRFRPDSYDKFIIDEVWKNDEYFLERADVPVDGCIVDIGAHIGAFAVKADSVFPGRTIIALEPVPANFRLLRQNLKRNGCRSGVALEMAVTATTGRTMVYLDPANTAGHSTAVHVSQVATPAKGITLADLVKRYDLPRLGFLKIDCEGGEYGILLASDFHALAPRISNLALEYHPVESHGFEQLRPLLEAEGFSMTAHKDGYLPGQGTALFQRKAA